MHLFKRCKFVCSTAAPPGKFGHHHVNCRTKEYWVETFAKHGLHYCPNLTDLMKSHSTMYREFLKNTGMVFFNRG
jgi:hypothetical protein